MTTNWLEYFQNIYGRDTTVDEIMEVYREAKEVYEESMIAMGQRTVVPGSKVVSTKDVIGLTPDRPSKNNYE